MVRMASALGALFLWVIAGCGEEAKPPVSEPIYAGNSAETAQPDPMRPVDSPSTEPEQVSEDPPEMMDRRFGGWQGEILTGKFSIGWDAWSPSAGLGRAMS